MFVSQIQSVVAEKEHEKFELKKFHTQTVMDLMNDAHRVLDEMENEYNFHKKTAVSSSIIAKSCVVRFLRN